MSRHAFKLSVLLSAVVVLAGAAAAMAAASPPRQARLGAPPQLPAGSTTTGSLSSATAIRSTVVLKPRDPTALEAYALAAATPGSSDYHHYLSVAAFRQRFGPTDAQIAAVSASLRAHGLAPGAVSANGLAIPVTATAGALGHAFSTSFRRLTLSSGRTAFANTQAPLLDTSIAGYVQGVLGLSSVAQLRPLALHAPHARAHATPHVVTGGPQACSGAVGSGFYTADDLAAAYRFSALYGAGDEGAGQTVAIYELEGNFPSDIAADESCYGISTPVSYVRVDGGPPAPNANNQDGLETALDVEQAINLAPQANVIVYQGPNTGSRLPGSGPYDTYSAIISQDRADVISTSWGDCESQLGSAAAAAENTLFQEAAVQGQSILSAAGDEGSTDCTDSAGKPVPQLAVDDPSAQPFVTGVGGTSLAGIGPPPAESVWNDSCQGTPCAGGGGISSFWGMPSYQSSAPSSLNVINGNSSGSPCGAAGSYCREVPDVAANADPSTGDAVYFDGSWGGIGGTSAAAPLYAALVALTNDSSACGGSPIGFANPALYRAAGASYSGSFQDITVGNNQLSGSGQSLYPAGPGYDMASGLGSPDGAALPSAMCSSKPQLANPGNQATVLGVPAQIQLSASDAAGKSLSFSATGLPTGLAMGASTGIISGTPATVGNFAPTVRVTDSDGASASVTFSWTVYPVAINVATPGSQRTRSGNKVSLQIRAGDNNGGQLSYHASGLPPGVSINPSSGLISGKPQNGGNFSPTLTVFDGGASSTVGFSWVVTPVVSRAVLSGVARNKPKLSVTLAAEPDSPRLKSIVITLPKHLAFNRAALGRGISLVGSKRKRLKGYKLKLTGAKLTITLRVANARVALAIRGPLIRSDRAVVAAVKHRKQGNVTLTVKTTDTSRLGATVTLKLKPS